MTRARSEVQQASATSRSMRNEYKSTVWPAWTSPRGAAACATALVVFVCSFAFGKAIESPLPSAISLSLAILALCWKYRQHSLVVAFLVFNLLFVADVFLSIAYGIPLFWGIAWDLLTPAYALHGVFLCGLFLPRIGSIHLPEIRIALRKGALLPLALIAACVALTWSISGSSVLFSERSYQTYQDNLREGSGAIEYTIMLFIVVGNFRMRRVVKTLHLLALAYYIAKTAAYGLRVQALMAVMVVVFVAFRRNLRFRSTIAVVMIGYFALLIAEGAKQGLLAGHDVRISPVDDSFGFIQSHHSGVLASTTAMLANERLFGGALYGIPAGLLAATLPPRVVYDIAPRAYPSKFIQQITYTPGGGLVSTQIFLNFSVVGVFVASVVFAFFVWRMCEHGVTSPAMFGFLGFMIFFPRWVSYDFLNYGVRTALLVCAGSLCVAVCDRRARWPMRLRRSGAGV